MSDPGLLPEKIQDTIEHNGLERAICDFMCARTEPFLIADHNKLFDPGFIIQ